MAIGPENIAESAQRKKILRVLRDLRCQILIGHGAKFGMNNFLESVSCNRRA